MKSCMILFIFTYFIVISPFESREVLTSGLPEQRQERHVPPVRLACAGRPKARCYPFNMKGHRFRGKNCQVLQRAGVSMLYDSASNPRLPCLYICPVANVLGRAPVIPCFIGGNRYPTIPATVTPRSHTASRTIGVLETPPPTRSGSRLYKVNI